MNARQQTAATAARGIASLRSLLALPNAGLVGVFILFIVAGALASPQFLTQSNIIYVGRALQPNGGDIVEIVGLPQLQLTKERSKGFADALRSYPNVRIVAQQAADFLPDKGLTVMGDVLNRVKKIDAVWNHDDDQGIGVLQAIRNAGREDEFFMVGGAGSAQAMQEIKKGGVLRATVLYSPSMASTSINLARLIAQGRGMDELAERETPSFMTLYSAVVTKDNVDQYLPVGF